MNNKVFQVIFFLTVSFFQVGYATENYTNMSLNDLNKALIIAVQKNNSDEISSLLQLGADANQTIKYYVTSGDCDWLVNNSLIEYAVEQNYGKVVQALIQSDIYASDRDAAFVLAAEKGYENIVEMMLSTHMSFQAIDQALVAAINKFYGQNYYLVIIKNLIHAGANVHYADDVGTTALMTIISNSPYRYSSSRSDVILAQKENRIELIELLLSLNININCCDKYGNTALMYAIQNHDLDSVKLLLQSPKIDINHVNCDGNTALIVTILSIQFTYIQGNQEQYDHCCHSQEILDEMLARPEIDFFHTNTKGETAMSLLSELLERMKY